jgi:hypothetical protein
MLGVEVQVCVFINLEVRFIFRPLRHWGNTSQYPSDRMWNGGGSAVCIDAGVKGNIVPPLGAVF